MSSEILEVRSRQRCLGLLFLGGDRQLCPLYLTHSIHDRYELKA
ncbi:MULTISPECIES: hypothetical protein [Kamptonema]|nr:MULTISPECIES: hypothetical protein [Kamptonema]